MTQEESEIGDIGGLDPLLLALKDRGRGLWAKSYRDVGRRLWGWEQPSDDSQRENGDLHKELHFTNNLNEQGPSRKKPSPAKTLTLAQRDTHQALDMYWNIHGFM